MAHVKPFAYYAKDGLVGYDVDIWKTIAEELKVQLRYIFLGGDLYGTRKLVFLPSTVNIIPRET